MPSAAADPHLALAIDRYTAAVAELRGVGADAVVDGRDAAIVIAEVEAVNGQAHAFGLDLQLQIGARGLHKADGHASAKVMVRHCGNLSDAEALRRSKAARVMRDLPVIGEAHPLGGWGCRSWIGWPGSTATPGSPI